MENTSFVLAMILLSVGSLLVFKALLKIDWIREWLSRSIFFHPNSISLYGGIFTIVGLSLLSKNYFHLPVWLYGMASFFDGADGAAAVAFDKKTKTGKWMDPFFDKFRYFSFLLFFNFSFQFLNQVVLFVFFGLDLISQLSRVVIGKMGWGNSKIEANCFGKAKTVVADILVGYCFVLSCNSAFPNFSTTFLVVLSALSVLSTFFKITPPQVVFGGFFRKVTQ